MLEYKEIQDHSLVNINKGNRMMFHLNLLEISHLTDKMRFREIKITLELTLFLIQVYNSQDLLKLISQVTQVVFNSINYPRCHLHLTFKQVKGKMFMLIKCMFKP